MTAADAERLPVPFDHGVDRTREAIELWGLCGLVSQQDQQVTGFVSLVPAVSPTTDARPSGRRCESAVLSGIWVDPAHRGRGLGRQLVQAAAAELVRRETVTVEAVGHRYPEHANGSGSADPVAVGRPEEIPVGFLEAVGFRVVHQHPTAPRLRMDLTTSLRWRPDLGAAWQRLTGLVSKPIPPQPAGFQHHRQAEDALPES